MLENYILKLVDLVFGYLSIVHSGNLMIYVLVQMVTRDGTRMEMKRNWTLMFLG